MRKRRLTMHPSVSEIAEAVSFSGEEVPVDIAVDDGTTVDYMRVFPYSLERDNQQIGRFLVKAVHGEDVLDIVIDPFGEDGSNGSVRVVTEDW